MEINYQKNLLIIILASIPFVSIFFLWQHSLALNILFMMVILFILLIEKNKTNLIYFSILFVSCASLEIVAVHLGIWTYMLHDFLGIPLWAPLGWALFGLAVLHFHLLLTKLLT